MKHVRMLVPLSAALIQVWSVPLSAESQETPALVALEATAVAAANHGLFAPAATLFTEAAALRSFGDERAIIDLRSAAMVRYYMGEKAEGLRLMSAAAGESVASGHFLLAVESYIDGAWIAMELGLEPVARQFVESAWSLAASTSLTASESSSILARLGERDSVLRLTER
jgi:hypothetical protein